MPTDLLAELQRRHQANALKPDPAQMRVAQRLQALGTQLAAAAPRGGLLARLGLAGRAGAAQAPPGIYIHGPVGRGKSMLMDLFFALAPVAKKRRVHFHEFMLEIHQRLHVRRQELIAKGAPPEADPIPPLARTLAGETRLLCFDEFQVTNIADAMILARLFGTLLDEGVTVVATSNRPPEDLYKNGLQRDRFLPFIDLLRARLEVIELAGGQDYRLARLRDMRVYITPLGPAAAEKMAAAFAQLTDDDPGHRTRIDVMGRELEVPKAAGAVAWFSFPDLCARPLGAADYIAIAENFHTVLVSDIPRLAAANHNEAFRFTTMIDAFYQHSVKLVCSAAAPPAELYAQGDFSFEFERTVSRLMEMQSQEYLRQNHVE